jgi:hypothetical protein
MLLPPWLQPKPTAFALNDEGVIVDPFSIEYRVLNGDTEYVTWTAATKLALGYYEATNYVAGAAPVGRRTVEWRMRLVTGGPLRSWSQAWDTYRTTMPRPVYALVSDLREQDITAAMVSDARAPVLLLQASIEVDNFTGRMFGARPMSFLDDGRGAHIHLFSEPVIGISELVIGAESLSSVEDAVNPSQYRIYNRHLLGVVQPDDRENPKLEFRGSSDSTCRSRFTRGTQNIRFAGLFGYTDPDGSPAGKVPDLIALATVLIAARLATTAGNPGGAVVDPNAWKITEERTRDQAVKYTSASGGSSTGTGRGNALQGAFTGDPTIDTILAMYCRGPNLAAV